METSFVGISHLDLSVIDVEASASWYELVLGLRRVKRVELTDRTMVVMLHKPSGLVVGLNEHKGSQGEPFDERRAGLDHVGFAVDTREELVVWQTRLVALGVEHSPVADTDVGSALVFRDPDNIQLELWWSEPHSPPATGRPGLVERSSPDTVAETVRRLVAAAEAHGVTVFTRVDHTAGARSVGLDMPETQVLLLGNPLVGTPVMLAEPDMALDLPTRLLVRAAATGTSGSTITFHDPADIGRTHALPPTLVDGLRGIVALVESVLEGDAPR